MQRQIAQHTVPRRASAPASTHRVGHNAGLHPEDTPYTTQDRQRQVMQPQQHDDEDDGDTYPQRAPSSAIRYTRQPEVYTQGNRRIVIHREQPPRKPSPHWMFFVGLAMCIMVVGYIALSAFGVWWKAKQDDWKYGNPRTFQTDQFVGHGDSPDHPDHFIALNAGGVIQIIEINTHIPKDDHVYPIATVTDSSTPVSVSFDDTNHDGKIDMLVTVGDSNPYIVILLNNGTQFAK